MELSQEQIKTLEEVFSSYSDAFREHSPFGSSHTTMEGILQQIQKLEGSSGYIYYANNCQIDGNGKVNAGLSKMFVGDQTEEVEDKSSLLSLENREALKVLHKLSDEEISQQLEELLILHGTKNLPRTLGDLHLIHGDPGDLL
jgi:hypothetical protein